MTGFEGLEPIFGEAKAEWASLGSVPLHRFFFYVHAMDPSSLKIIVTDFRSSTWETVRSVEQLEDTRDGIGIGGSWYEFVDYVIASLKSEDVKLVLKGGSTLDGVSRANLVAQKSKGMPRISFSVAKLVDSVGSEAIANLSLELFKVFQRLQSSVIEEKERSHQLMKVISAEREKNKSMQSQLDLYSKRQKLQDTNFSDKSNVSTSLTSSDTNGKVVARDKVPNRVVPAFRRARVRGALLRDNDDEDDT